jgi:GTPase SAR1 family protein
VEYWIERVDELNCVKFSTTSEWHTRVLDRVRMLVHETACDFSTNLEQRLRWRVLLPLGDGSFVDYESLDAADPGVLFDQHFGLDTASQVRDRVDLRQWFKHSILERADAVQGALKEKGITFSPLRRAKVILCGQGRVGKTSLRKALTGQPFKDDEESTAGAQVTCALVRVEASQAGSGWEVNESDISDWDEEAQLAYLQGRLGSDSSRWLARVHADAASAASHPLPPVTEHTQAEGGTAHDDGANPSSGDGDIQSSGPSLPSTDTSNVPQRAPTVHKQSTANRSKSSGARTVEDAMKKKKEWIQRRLAELNATGADTPINVSVWDLGGQRVFQALQQLFLNKSAIYVITFDLSDFVKGGEGYDDAVAELRFWCDTVASCALGKGGGDNGRIVIVGTCRDKMGSDDTADAALHLAREVVDTTLLRRVVTIDCVDNTRSDKGESIARLRGVLDRYVSESRDVQDHVPLNYRRLLLRLLRENKQRLSFGEVEAIASECNMPTLPGEILLKDEVHDALHTLHRLGQLLWWRDNKRLRDTIIIDPKWLITAFTAVIRNRELHPLPSVDSELDRIVEAHEGQPRDAGVVDDRTRDSIADKAGAVKLLYGSWILTDSLFSSVWPVARSDDKGAAPDDSLNYTEDDHEVRGGNMA